MKSIPPQQFPPREAFLRGKKNPGAEGFSSRRIEGFSDLIPVVLPCNISFSTTRTRSTWVWSPCAPRGLNILSRDPKDPLSRCRLTPQARNHVDGAVKNCIIRYDFVVGGTTRSCSRTTLAKQPDACARRVRGVRVEQIRWVCTLVANERSDTHPSRTLPRYRHRMAELVDTDGANTKPSRGRCARRARPQ